MIISWQALESIARVGTPSDFHCGIISLILFRTFMVQRISLTASVVAINSASAEDSATVGCPSNKGIPKKNSESSRRVEPYLLV